MRRALALLAVALALGWLVSGSVERAAQARLMPVVAASSGPADFVSDGCSGGLSALWPGEGPPWTGCCVAHDGAYHVAGGARTAEEGLSARLRADAELRACVVRDGAVRRSALAADWGVAPGLVDAAYAVTAWAMYRAVRLGGLPCTGLPWRWGFGFADCAPWR